MEGNISGGNVFDSKGLVNHHQSPHCQGRPGGLVCPSTVVHSLEFEKSDNVVERAKNSQSDEEEHSFSEEGDPSKGNKVCWRRVKWVDSMITAVSYLGEHALLESGVFGRRKLSSLHKKGKWTLVSKAMGGRGYCVSPQQCEDKFNDLNKRYKKLNDILGRGTSCQVVEKPAILDMMDHLSEKMKDEVRKILSSKHLFYEEMCSYHNNNRLHLPHDPALQRFLLLALKCRDDYDIDFGRHLRDDHDEDDHDVETDDHEEYDENYSRRAYVVGVGSSKRRKLGHGLDEFKFDNPLSMQLQSENRQIDKWSNSRSLQLQELRLKIEMETLELEKQRFKWQRFSRKKIENSRN
ncbi:hypothetical protein RND81_01G160900 [Saponaria officinalis]|uniref:Myb/SANT-like DNA-binding domain-containing protein n=1 Tax=Saponaria officinalis TaxID=3572 RepID=A0AAW1NHK0_SAPOF